MDKVNVREDKNDRIFNNMPYGDEEIDGLIDNIMVDVLTNFSLIFVKGMADFNVYKKNNKIVIDVGTEARHKNDDYILYHIECEKEKCYCEKGKANSYMGHDVEISERYSLLNIDCPRKDYEFLYRWSSRLYDIMNLEKDYLCKNDINKIYKN